MWIVKVTPPVGGWTTYKPDYFPRKVYYKKDALVLAEEARKAGGTAITVTKEKK